MKDLLEEIRNLLNGSELCEDKIQLINEKVDFLEEEVKAHSHTKTLVEFSRELTKSKSLEDIMSFAVSKMSEFLSIDESLLFFSTCMEDETLERKSFVGSKKIEKTLLKIFQEENIPDRIPISPAQKSAVLSNTLYKLPSMRTIMMDNISQDTAIEWEEKLGVSHFYGYGFSNGEHLLATFGIISKVEIKPSIFQLFETLLNLLNTIIVQKAESEQTITLYNHMTRILDISHYAFGIFSKNGNLLKGNETFTRLFSVFPAHALNLHHKVFYNEIGLSQSNIDDIKKGYAINIDPENFSSLFEDQISGFTGGNITPVITHNNEVEYYLLFMISKAEDFRLLKSMQLQEEKYQRIFHYIQDVYFEINFEGKILEMSPSIEKYLSKPREFFIGKNILQFYKDPEDRKDYLAELSKHGKVENYRIDFRNMEGEVVHCITNASIVDPGTENERIVGSLTDFSEQYKIHQQIVESESKLRSLFDHSPLGILICDTHGKIIDINQRLLAILGSPSKDKTRKINIFELQNLKESGIADEIRSCLNTGDNTVFETKYNSFWGKEAYAKIFINPIIVEDETSFVILMAEDITEIKAIDIKLQETRERLKDIYEKTNDLIYTMDFDGNFTSVNPIGEKWLGYKYDELQNHNMRQFISLDSAKRAAENIQKKLRGSSDHTSYEIEAFTRGGQKMILEVNSFLRYKDNKPIEVFGIARDITERKKHEEFIQTSLLEKEALNKEMHHRVKNNLQMIISLMKMHQKKRGNDQINHILNDISQKILAISAVHEDFYFSNSYKEIPFKSYFETLLINALENTDKGKDVTSKLDIGDINADIDTAIPIGLIVSELIHNSLYHAFSEDMEKMEIRISMSSIGKHIKLIYSDNGSGFDSTILEKEDQNSGIQLIKMLAENQLDGTFNIESGNQGTKVQIEFTGRKV